MNAPTHSQEKIFAPKLFTLLPTYSRAAFWTDLQSGLIVGIVALPLAIAFGIASGVTPERGIVTAIVAGFLISLLGGSRVQIGGPTGAFVVIVYGIVASYGVNGLLLCTMIAGVLLILMGLLRLGSIIRFIPYPLTVGFTAGIALIIFSSQVKDLLGLRIEGVVPAEFLGKWEANFQALGTIHLPTVLLSLLSLAILLFWPKINRKIPASLVAILLVTALVRFFGIQVETIGSRFGELPAGLPAPALPDFTWAQIKGLISPAFTVALLGAIESLLSATVADGMIEGRHRPNTELIGQGIANLLTPLFGGIPATGAIARTATNVRNGGRTPVAGIVHAITLFVIVLLFGRYAAWIPMCVLAAILVLVSYHMSEWHSIRSLWKGAPRMDVAVLAVTFLLTVFVDLTVGVEIGLLLSAVLFMKRMTDVTTVREITKELSAPPTERELREEEDATSRREIPQGVMVFEAQGALFFGVAEVLRETLVRVGQKPPKALILRMRNLLALDATGIRALDGLHKSALRLGTKLLLAGVHDQPLASLQKDGLYERIGAENILPNLDQALERASQIPLSG